MLKTNYHSHSEFCDGKGKLEDYVKSAISKGFDVFGFSGHAPLPFERQRCIFFRQSPVIFHFHH